MERIATPDQVIARHVQRLREARDLSVSDLARMMKVNRKTIYDYEHRGGRPHAFKWSELIALSQALESSIFELVFPPEGTVLDVPPWVLIGKAATAPDVEVTINIENAKGFKAVGFSDMDIDAGELAVMATFPPGRDELAQVVFHWPASVLAPLIEGELPVEFQEFTKTIRAARVEAREAMIAAIRKALTDMEGETQ